MAFTSLAGPLVVLGQNPALNSQSTPDYNWDWGPSGVSIGMMLLDGRYPVGAASQSGEQTAIGFFRGGRIIAMDQAPSAISTTNIAAAHTVTTGVAMTLVSSSGSGITVTTAPTLVQQSLQTVASGALIIDSAPAIITYGQNSTIGVFDPRTASARAVAITAAAAATGGHFVVSGADLWGFPQTENINVAGNGTTNGAKTWKFITSVVPQFTDTTSGHTYSVGTSDIYGFPIAVYEFAFVDIVWNNAVIVANSGFTAAVTTAPSPTTGDVRGSYAVQSASDGTKKLQLFIDINPVNAFNLNGTTSVFGQVPA